MLHAENAYLFRHAITRDAVYQMQLPSERAKGHELAFHLIQAAHGGRAPVGDIVAFSKDSRSYQPHGTDIVSVDLAEHAELSGVLPEMHGLYMFRSAIYLQKDRRSEVAASTWLKLAEMSDGLEKGHALRMARGRKGSRAVEIFDQVLEVAKTYNDKLLEATVLHEMATDLRIAGKVELSEEYFLRALPLARELGYQECLFWCSAEYGSLLLKTGRYEQAHEFLIESLEIAETLEDTYKATLIRVRIGMYFIETKQFETGLDYLYKAAQMFEQLGMRNLLGLTFGNIGYANQQVSNYDVAEDYTKRAIAISKEVDNSMGRNHWLICLGTIQFDKREFSEAKNSLQSALEHALNTTLKGQQCEAYLFLALTHLCTSLRDDGFRLWQKGAKLMAETKDAALKDTVNTSMKNCCAELCLQPFEYLE